MIKRFARKEGERRKPRTFLSKNDRMKRIRFRTKSRLQDNRCRLFLLISRQLRHIRAARVCVDDAPWKRPALINEAFRWTWVYFRFGVYALGIRGKRVIAWNKIIWIVSHRAHANQRFDFGKKENRGRIRCEWYEDRMVTRALFSIIPSFPFFLFLLTGCTHGRDRYWEFDLTSVKIDEDKFEDRTASSELWYLDILNFELLRKFW